MYKKNSNGFIPEHLENYEVEADEIIRRLKTEPRFCQQFFYGTESDECIIAPMRSTVLSDLKRNYHVEVSKDYFSTILYQTLLAEGTWTTLDTYKKQSTFFVWMKKVAKNAILDRMGKENCIYETHSRTVGNTRLALLSQPTEKCQLIIDELLRGSEYHDLLCSIYGSRLAKEEIMENFNLTEQEFEKARREGERELKDALLRSSFGYEEEVLRDKTHNTLTVSSEFVADMGEWFSANTEENPFADVFGVNLTDEEVHEKVVDFLYDFSAKLDWSEQDRELWRQRFVNNTPPVKLAEAMNKPRAWVDTRYSRLNKKFESAVRKWWQAHAE